MDGNWNATGLELTSGEPVESGSADRLQVGGRRFGTRALAVMRPWTQDIATQQTWQAALAQEQAGAS